MAEVEADWERLRDIRRPVKALADILRIEIDQLLDERKRVKGGGNAWEDAAVASKLQKLTRLSRDTTLDLVQINELLRSLFLKVVLDYENSQALIYWKHGGSSTVLIDVSRQRQQRNPPWKGKPKDRVAVSAVLSSRSTLLGNK